MTLFYLGSPNLSELEYLANRDEPVLNDGGEANGKSIFVIVTITTVWRIICRAWIRIATLIGLTLLSDWSDYSANGKFSLKTLPERTIIDICIIIIIREIDNIKLEFERWNFWVIKRLISGQQKTKMLNT